MQQMVLIGMLAVCWDSTNSSYEQTVQREADVVGTCGLFEPRYWRVVYALTLLQDAAFLVRRTRTDFKGVAWVPPRDRTMARALPTNL